MSEQCANEATALQDVDSWIQRAVIGFNLCPFAHKVLRDGGVSKSSHHANCIEDAAEQAALKANSLASQSIDRTHLLVFLTGLSDFDVFLDAVHLVELLLQGLGLEHDIQLAHFHPRYRFEGVGYSDAANYSNRSPYPIIQLLRAPGVARAVEKHPDTLAIPDENIRRLRQLTPEELDRLQFG